MDDILFQCSGMDSVNKVKNHLRELNFSSSLPNVFWLPVPEFLLTDVQREHLSSCGPYKMAFVANDSAFVLETIVRGENTLHCSCLGKASGELETYMSKYIMDLIKKIDLSLN